GAGFVFGPVVGAIVTVLLPELLSGLAEYRLLFVGVLLLVVLWLAPEGVIGTIARYLRRAKPAGVTTGDSTVTQFLAVENAPPLSVSKIRISFCGVETAHAVT